MNFKNFYFLFEGVNINKDYLIKLAGDEAKFKKAKSTVEKAANSIGLSQVFSKKESDNNYVMILNFLTKLEIEKEDSVTDKYINFFHDMISDGKMSDVQKIAKDSDITVSKFDDMVDDFNRNRKLKKGMTADEYRQFNNYEVVHEFNDDIKWVIPLSKEGARLGACKLVGDQGQHCGNVPSLQSGDVMYVLRKGDEVHATAIIDKSGKVRENKGTNNQRVVRDYHKYIVWLYKQPFVKGFTTGHSAHTDTRMIDIILSHPEEKDWFMKHKPELFSTNDEYLHQLTDDIKKHKYTIQDAVKKFIDDKMTFSQEHKYTEDSTAKKKIVFKMTLSNLIYLADGKTSNIPDVENFFMKHVYNKYGSIPEIASIDITFFRNKDIVTALLKNNIKNLKGLYDLKSMVPTYKIPVDEDQFFKGKKGSTDLELEKLEAVHDIKATIEDDMLVIHGNLVL